MLIPVELNPDIPVLGHRSTIAIRPIGQSTDVKRDLISKAIFSGVVDYKLYNNNDWDGFANILATTLDFPSAVTHSTQAMCDFITDMSWSTGKKYAIFVDISNLDSNSDVICYAIDAIMRGILQQDLETNAKIAFVIFI